MITLQTTDILRIINKQLPLFFHEDVHHLSMSQDVPTYDEKQKRPTPFTNEHYWVKLMNCQMETFERHILLCEVIYFMKKEYPDADIKLHAYIHSNNESEAIIKLEAFVTFDDEANLSPQDLPDLIDIALALRDRTWFDELTHKQKMNA